MIIGYRYTDADGNEVQIACNSNKRWYERTCIKGRFYFGVWKTTPPPTINDGHIRLNRASYPVKRLRNTPFGLPTV